MLAYVWTISSSITLCGLSFMRRDRETCCMRFRPECICKEAAAWSPCRASMHMKRAQAINAVRRALGFLESVPRK